MEEPQVNCKILKTIALGLSNTYTEVSRTFKGDLCNSPHAALVGRETPDGRGTSVVLQEKDIQCTNSCAIHVVPELEASSIRGFELRAYKPGFVSL